MGVDPLSAALLATGSGLVAGGTSFLGSKKSKRDSKQAQRRGERELDRVTAERQDEIARSEAQVQAKRDRERQRALAFMNSGRAGTVHTSKIGLPGGQTYAPKLAIGAA